MIKQHFCSFTMCNQNHNFELEILRDSCPHFRPSSEFLKISNTLISFAPLKPGSNTVGVQAALFALVGLAVPPSWTICAPSALSALAQLARPCSRAVVVDPTFCASPIFASQKFGQ